MKQIKILAVLAISLCLGLASCGQSAEEGGDEPEVSECKSHKWGKEKLNEVAATCTTDGSYEQKCTVCGAVQKKTVKALGHDMKDVEGSNTATCLVAGTKQQKCSRCDHTETVNVEALGHDWVADTTKTDTVSTCSTHGIHYVVCSRCQLEDQQELDLADHTWIDEDNDGEADVTWSTEPTCEEGGEGVKTCEVCGATEAVVAEALGHEWTTEGGTKTPAQGEGFADFWEFPCAHGCGKTSLGFYANEPTAASLPHLVIGSDGGARFWGRPIGNAVALNSEGTADSSNHDPIFDKDEPGDFFEYKFTLTAAQAETLSTCRCYCDAKPASYLAGKDFWKCKENDEEWTPGMYIDDDPAHLEFESDGVTPVMVPRLDPDTKEPTEEMVQKGKVIDDYRYILYVDGEVKAFDPTIEAPVGGRSGSEPRQEYVMPFTFNLHEGENTISLRMAGGYRSTFYAFYFRQYVAPAPVAPVD